MPSLARQMASVIIPRNTDLSHKEFFVLSILQAAGWPIWPLLICSVLVLALIIERAVQLQSHKVAPPNLLDRTLEVVRRVPADDEIMKQLAQSGHLGPVLAAGLQVLRDQPTASNEDVRSGMEMAGRQATQELERYLGTLGTLASAAPLLGLLGTVVGMIEIFAAQQGSGTQPAQLAHGISVALYNTAFGLIVAIPALLAWRFFRARVDRHVLGLEAAAERFARHLAQVRR